MSHAKVIIWDLGDVLFKQNHLAIAHTIGLSRFITYSLADWKNPQIKPLLFDVLETFGTQEAPEHQKVRDRQGIPLPQIMCDWMTGKAKYDDIIARSHERIDKLYDEGYFVSQREKDLIKETIGVVFNPDHFAYHNKPIKKGIDLLKECAAYTDQDGKQHTLIVLSNWDPDSFDILYEYYWDLFQLFDHVFISGEMGYAKPNYCSFEYILKTLKLDPEDCYFIDDQQNNVQAAQDCKINGLWLKNGNYRELRKKMKDLKLL